MKRLKNIYLENNTKTKSTDDFTSAKEATGNIILKESDIVCNVSKFTLKNAFVSNYNRLNLKFDVKSGTGEVFKNVKENYNHQFIILEPNAKIQVSDIISANHEDFRKYALKDVAVLKNGYKIVMPSEFNGSYYDFKDVLMRFADKVECVLGQNPEMAYVRDFANTKEFAQFYFNIRKQTIHKQIQDKNKSYAKALENLTILDMELEKFQEQINALEKNNISEEFISKYRQTALEKDKVIKYETHKINTLNKMHHIFLKKKQYEVAKLNSQENRFSK